MSESVSDIRRVAIDLSAEHIPELMGVLGGFVASHNLRIEFGSPEPMNKQETLYNPELVDWLVDPASGVEVAVVTKHSLKAFERKLVAENPSKHPTPVKAERIFNATTRLAMQQDRVVLPFAVMADNTMVGLRADSLQRFAEGLATESIDIINLGVKAGEFLLDVCKELTVSK